MALQTMAKVSATTCWSWREKGGNRRASATTGPFQLVAGLYALGWALWTGVVVALFVEIIPRGQNGVKSSGRSMPTRLPCVRRPKPRSVQTSKGDA